MLLGVVVVASVLVEVAFPCPRRRHSLARALRGEQRRESGHAEEKARESWAVVLKGFFRRQQQQQLSTVGRKHWTG